MSKIVPLHPGGLSPSYRTPWAEHLNEQLSPFDDQPISRAELFDLLIDMHWFMTDGPDKPTTPPSMRRPGGRPPKPFLAELSGFGGGWLAANGIPDTQAELESVLLDECSRRGWGYSERQVRELAGGLISGYKAALRDG